MYEQIQIFHSLPKEAQDQIYGKVDEE